MSASEAAAQARAKVALSRRRLRMSALNPYAFAARAHEVIEVQPAPVHQREGDLLEVADLAAARSHAQYANALADFVGRVFSRLDQRRQSGLQWLQARAEQSRLNVVEESFH